MTEHLFQYLYYGVEVPVRRRTGAAALWV